MALKASLGASILVENGKMMRLVNVSEKKLLADAGRRIREVRTGQALSLEQLALLTGISAPALSVIENGKRDPRLTTLHRIAEALRVPLAALIAERVGAAESVVPSPSAGYDLGVYQ